MKAIDLPESLALLAALPEAAALVRQPEVAASWSLSSQLTGFTVGGVAGHLFRATQRLLPTLDGPAPAGEPAGFEAWYLANRMAGPEDLDGDIARWIVDDGEHLAAKGPAVVASRLETLTSEVRERLAVEDAERNVAVLRADRPVPLRAYLGSRLLEVVIHADDLAVSAGLARSPIEDHIVGVACDLLTTMARARSGNLAVLRALTRADRVADPYEVLRVL